MNENEATEFLRNAVDGQAIRVTAVSGRTFEGIYDSEQSSLEDALYFDTMEGTACRAEWQNVADISYRSARTLGRAMMVPPEHPLSGVRQNAHRPYTTRNR